MLVAGMTGCKKYLDINSDPASPNVPSLPALLSPNSGPIQPYKKPMTFTMPTRVAPVRVTRDGEMSISYKVPLSTLSFNKEQRMSNGTMWVLLLHFVHGDSNT
jgi:hypothetical protein